MLMFSAFLMIIIYICKYYEGSTRMMSRDFYKVLTRIVTFTALNLDLSPHDLCKKS